MYSGENVVVLAPDSEILSVLQAALSSEDPDTALPKHAQFAFANGEARVLNPVKLYSFSSLCFKQYL